MNFGATFKKFRLNKGLSLVQAAKDIVSPQFLGRFEKGQSDITVSNLYLLLQNLNVSLEEFFYDYGKNTEVFSLETFEEQLDIIYHMNDKNLWNKLYRKNLEQLTEEKNQYYHIDQCLKKWSNHVFKTEYVLDIQTIIDYLEGIETWGQYEYFLATFFIIHIPAQRLGLLFQKVFQQKAAQRPLQIRVFDFYFSICLYLILEKEFPLAEKVVNYYDKIQDPEKVLLNMPILACQKVLKSILLIEKDPQQGILKCRQALNLFEELGFDFYAERLKKNIFQVTGEKI